MRTTTTHPPAHAARGPVVGPLKTLMTGYQLWGRANACDADQLSAMFHIPPAELLEAMAALAQEGIVLIDHERRTLSLTEAGARALALLPSGHDA